MKKKHELDRTTLVYTNFIFEVNICQYHKNHKFIIIILQVQLYVQCHGD